MSARNHPSAGAVLAATFGTILGSSFSVHAFAQESPRELFDAAVEAVRSGRDDDAVLALEGILAADLSPEAAAALRAETNSLDWLVLVDAAGAVGRIANHLEAKAKVGGPAPSDDPTVISERVAAALGDDPQARRRATGELAAENGPFAVPYLLVAFYQGGRAERLERARIAIARLGRSAVAPLVEALRHPDVSVRANSAEALGRLGDDRAVPALSALAARAGVRHASASRPAAGSGTANRPTTRDERAASAAIRAITGREPASLPPAMTLLLGQARAAYRAGEESLHAAEPGDVVWTIDGSRLEGRKIPRALHGLVTAERRALDANSLDTSAPEPLGLAAAALVARRDAVKALRAAGDTDPSLEEAEADLASLDSDLPAIGATAIAAGIRFAMAEGDAAVAAELLRVLGSVETPDRMVSAPVLQSALGSGHRRIAREAAVAVANIRPPAASIDDAGAVLPPLAEALSGRPIPRVLVIHESETFRTALVDLFRPLGFDAAPLDSGAAGLALARRQPPFDLILVSASLEDRLTDEIVDALKADPRTADAPVAVVIPEGEEATRYERLFGDKVIGFVGLPPEHEQIEAIVEGAAAARPSVDASTVEELATRAAAGLASLAGAPAALGWDVSAAVGPLAATLRDGTRPADLRIECAKALGSVVARGRGSSGAALKALAGALADPDEGVRAAAGAAIGRARRRP